MITEVQKQKILAAVKQNRTNYPSDAKHAASLGISTSVYSGIKNGQTDKALSAANWIGICLLYTSRHHWNIEGGHRLETIL